MPLYDFECSEGHVFEVRCSIADREHDYPCTAWVSTGPNEKTQCCHTSHRVILSAPCLNNPDVAVLSYPGSKKLRAGYVHSHGDRPANKTSAGYGGMIQANTHRHAHPVSAGIQPEAVKRSK